MSGFDELLAESVARSRAKAKKKWAGTFKEGSKTGQFFEGLDTLKGFSSEFRSSLRKKVIGGLFGLIGL